MATNTNLPKSAKAAERSSLEGLGSFLDHPVREKVPSQLHDPGPNVFPLKSHRVTLYHDDDVGRDDHLFLAVAVARPAPAPATVLSTHRQHPLGV